MSKNIHVQKQFYNIKTRTINYEIGIKFSSVNKTYFR